MLSAEVIMNDPTFSIAIAGVEPLNFAATSVGETPRRVTDTRRSGLVGLGRPLSGVMGADPKTATQRVRSAAALFRPLRSGDFVIQLIVHRRGDRPSRRRYREHRPRRAVFPRRETGGPSRPV